MPKLNLVEAIKNAVDTNILTLYPDMVEALFKTMPTPVESMLHATVGISGEIAEYWTAAFIDDKENAKEELGDMFFYFVALLRFAGKGLIQLNAFTPDRVPFLPTIDADGEEAELDVVAMFDLPIIAGELLDMVKKTWVYGKELDHVAFLALMRKWYGAFILVVEKMELTISAVLIANADKLGKRYPDGVYSNKDALARADKEPETLPFGNMPGTDTAPFNDGMGAVGCSTVTVDNVAYESEGGACD